MKYYTCIICPKGCKILENNGEITGYTCKRGLEYVKQEIHDPKRTLTTSFKCGNKVCSCKSSLPLKKDLIFDVMKEINKINILPPIKMHQIIIENVLNTGVNIIATKEILDD